MQDVNTTLVIYGWCLVEVELTLCVHSNFVTYVYVNMSFCKSIWCVCLFIYLLVIYLNLSRGRVLGRSVPLTNIWHELDM